MRLLFWILILYVFTATITYFIYRFQHSICSSFVFNLLTQKTHK
jgi:hypothetical protein